MRQFVDENKNIIGEQKRIEWEAQKAKLARIDKTAANLRAIRESAEV